MVRHIVLGNQQLLVNIDKWLQVRDIYFPHVGQYNHLLGHAHRICVLEGASQSWINEDSWIKEVKYKNETLVTDSSAENKNMDLSINFNENVYCDENIFFRKLTVKNHSPIKRNIRVCFHHDFHLYGDGIGDTALYHPKENAVIHYKRSTYFLIGLCGNNKCGLSDYNIGEDVIPSFDMAKNPIAQGEVDSIICADIEINPDSEETITYYMCVGKNFDEVFELNKKFLQRKVEEHLQNSEMCQRGFLALIKPNISIMDQRVQDLYKRSLLIIQTQIDKQGAIIAANDSDNMQFNKDTYSYMWPRDGALVAITLIKAGYSELVKDFFEFCKRAMEKEGYLLHKYNPDATLGSSWHPWINKDRFSLPIQEDETALVLHALWMYYEETNDRVLIRKLYSTMIKPMGDFLSKYRYDNGLPKESHDLWEERRGIFTFTASAVLAGIIAAHKFADLFEDKHLCEECNTGYKAIKESMIKYLYNKEKKYFRRSVSFENNEIKYDEAMDSSCYGLFEFNIFEAEDPKVAATMEKVNSWLKIKKGIGGIARYYDDYYFQKSRDLENIPGNPWFICTLWYAKWIIKKSSNKEELKEALSLINWCVDNSLSTGILPEQLHPETGEPLSVSPLTWSHAEFVDTVTNYVEKFKILDEL